MDITELKRRRACLFAKRSLLKKKGLDYSAVSKELDEIKAVLEKSASGKPAKSAKTPKAADRTTSSKTKQPKQAVNIAPIDFVKSCIKQYGWKSGMNFGRFGCTSITLNNLKTKDVPAKNEVLMTFVLRYQTKRHEVENHVSWHIPYAKVSLFPNDLHNVQYGVKTQKVFSDKKFVVEKFNESCLPAKGWKLVK